MTYEEALVCLESFVNYEKKTRYNHFAAFNLARIKKFLSILGDPQDQLKIIHVAGTKGKGSTSCFIAHILKEEGYRVGLYTSPHLKDLRERIRILDPNNTADEKSFFPGMILKNDLAALLESLARKIESFNLEFTDLGKLTFFEVLTVMALTYFKDKGVDFAVLETGLGGRFDATNATNAQVSVITPISYDHEQILGQTLPEIAFEKAGIIKLSNVKTSSGLSVTVTAEQPREVMDVFRRRAASQGSALFEINKDFYFKRLSGDLMSQEFFYKGLNEGSFFFKTRMLGTHQLVNASLSLAACEALFLHGLRIRSDSMALGLWNAFWPGRLEVICTKPFIILDGAHNRDSANCLARFIEKEFKKSCKWLVFGASEDKDLKGIVEQLEPMADKVILTRSENPRSADPEKTIRPFFKNSDLAVTNSVEQALELLNKQIKEEEVAVITGSLFVVGEARALWRK